MPRIEGMRIFVVELIIYVVAKVDVRKVGMRMVVRMHAFHSIKSIFVRGMLVLLKGIHGLFIAVAMPLRNGDGHLIIIVLGQRYGDLV